MSEGRPILRLAGPFRVETPTRTDVTARGRRAQAILAILALSPQGLRSRRWLQDKLWSDRPQPQAAASLRQELSALKRHFEAVDLDILDIARDTVGLRPGAACLDLGRDDAATSELLEGFDIGDPEFEDWLRLERSRFEDGRGIASTDKTGAEPVRPARDAGTPGAPHDRATPGTDLLPRLPGFDRPCIGLSVEGPPGDGALAGDLLIDL